MRRLITDKSLVAIMAVAVLALLLAAVPLVSNVRAAIPPPAPTSPVASKINYQGHLRDSFGSPLTGAFNMQFQFWTDPVGGIPVGDPISESGVVVTNGLFSVKLDVDESHFNGQGLWLEVTVEGELLGPRQEILPVPYAVHSLEPCVQYDVSGELGDPETQVAVDVPPFCIDGICDILLWWEGAPLGAFNPGFFWPAYYMQRLSDNSWIGGPHISIAGTQISTGAGVNGDGQSTGVCIGGQTSGGGYVSLYDDGTAENSPYEWTIKFKPDPIPRPDHPEDPELNEGCFYVCPRCRLPNP